MKTLAPEYGPIQLNLPPSSFREFEDMASSTRKRAYTMAYQLTRNASDAEDLLQETYVKAWRGFGSYMPGRPFLNWVLRIMQRAYLDSKRRDNPIRKADSLSSMVSPSDGEIQEIPIPDTGAAPDEIAMQSELSQDIRAALDEIPEVYRHAIVACDLEGLSYAEIAEQQNTTIGTIRSRIHRGRKLLREVVLEREIYSL